MVRRAAALIVTLTACGSFGSAADAPAESDAGSDGGSSPAIDGGGDASDATSSDGAATCTGWDPFDDAFERMDVRGAWSDVPQRGDGITFTLDAAPKPRGSSLHVVVTQSGADRGRSLEDRAPSVVPTCVELTFALNVLDHNDQVSSIATIEMDDATTIGVWLESNQLAFVQQESDGEPFDTVAHEGITLKDWHVVKLRYRATGGAPVMSANVDGKEIATAPSSVVLGAPMVIRIGAGYAKPTAAGEYWIDDVSIR